MIRLHPFLIFPICFTVIYTGFSARILPLEKALTGGCFILIICFAAGLPKRGAIPTWCALTAVHSATLFLPLLHHDTIRLPWVLSSFATYSSVAAFSVFALKLSDQGSVTFFRYYLASLALAMICAPAALFLFNAPRFEPPAFFLIAFVLVWFAHIRGRKAVLALVIILALAFASQVRINLLICLGFVGILSITRIRHPQTRLIFLTLTGIAFIWFIPSLPYLSEGHLPGLRRLSKIMTVDGFYTEVILRRSLELHAAWDAFTSASPFEILFGHGHGASYPARLLLLDLSAEHGSVAWRFTENSDAFVLHFGPMRLLYRTGILGLLLFTIPVILAAKHGILFLINPRNPANTTEFWMHVCSLAALMWLGKFMISPAETDIGFCISVGGSLALAYKTRPGSFTIFNHNQKPQSKVPAKSQPS